MPPSTGRASPTSSTSWSAGVNPVAGPFLNLSTTVPLGVCALACPDEGVRGVLGLVCPAIMAGNAVVALAGGTAALVTSTLGEVVATSDVPGGVVNLLTGEHAQLLPWLADHDDVDLIDLSGAPPDLARRPRGAGRREPQAHRAHRRAGGPADGDGLLRDPHGLAPGAHLMITVHDEVAAALAAGRPVVALESTIIAHGLPRPDNLRIAGEIEAAVRAEGAVPATIAVVGGRVRVGLDTAALEAIALGFDVDKLSLRDLGPALVSGRPGATTVASTAHLAARAGIAVFATGGLGGVHREASTTFDESADLAGLAATPIVVVCAGVKSILDVGATLERLETLSVPVLGYGTDRLAGFYLADSGHAVPWRQDSVGGDRRHPPRPRGPRPPAGADRVEPAPGRAADGSGPARPRPRGGPRCRGGRRGGRQGCHALHPRALPRAHGRGEPAGQRGPGAAQCGARGADRGGPRLPLRRRAAADRSWCWATS